MAQLLVRKLEASVVRRLRARAAREGISAEEAHRRILRESLAPGEAGLKFRDFKEALLAMPAVGRDSDFARRRSSRRRSSI